MEENGTFKKLCFSLDVDEESLETLLPYLEWLLEIGVNFDDLWLQQAMEGHMNQLEAACQSVIGYAGYLTQRGARFESASHATRCFNKALTEPWQPYPDWKARVRTIAQAKYISPYERARSLLHALIKRDNRRSVELRRLDALSDEEIEKLIPNLERELGNGR